MSKAPEFSYTPDQVTNLGDNLIKDLEEKLRVMINIPGPQRNFRNTPLAFEQATADFDEALTIPVFLAYTSDNADLRKAAQDLQLRISQYSVDLYTREDIYKALSEYAAKGEKLEEVDARLLDKTLLDFKRNGLGLPPRPRARVKKLMKELIGLELQFSKNLREVKDALEVTEAELAGLPDDFKARLKRTDGGGYLVTMDAPDYLPFIDNAAAGDARRRLEALYNNRCAAVNVELMEKSLVLRRKIAKILGYPTFSHYVLADRMAGSPETVVSFLERTWEKLKKKGRRELRERLKLKGGEDKVLNAWEWRYYNNQLKKSKYAIDYEKIKEYFPLETVIDGMFGVFGEVFGAKFVPAQLPVWHKDVRSYEVRGSDGRVEAYFYFDLFPRDGKYKHQACFGIRHGRELADGSYELPAAAIVGNFPPAAPGQPPLLKFNDVVTFFHEFGHVTHNIFTKARYAKFSGTSVSRDFVEVPSKMLENWAFDPAVLRRVSGHFKDPSQKLPDETIKKLVAAKNMDSGLVYLRQLFFSLLDLRYHTAKGKVNTTKVYEKLMKKISLIPLSPENYPQANFGHLMGGYEAGYYSYLWSEVIAADLFGAFEAAGVTNPETGKKYRELILAPGRSYDEAGQVEKFLGRPAGGDAFLRSIGAA